MKKLVCAAVLAMVGLSAHAGADKKEHTRVGEAAPPDMKIAGKMTIGSLHGKPILLHIWATWCGPCKVSLPEFKRIAMDYKNSDLKVIMLDRDDDGMAPHQYLALLGFPWLDYHDNGRFFSTFGGHGIPATVVIDRDGIVRYHHTGEGVSEKSEAKLRRAIERSINNPVTPPGGQIAPGDDDKDGQ